MITRRTVQIKGLYGTTCVTADVVGDWACHENVDAPGQWVITLLPLGLNLGPRWATFLSRDRAIRAAQAIARMRNDWARITQADLTPELKTRIKRVVTRYGAVRGPNSIAQLADRNVFGAVVTRRLNNYAMPEPMP